MATGRKRASGAAGEAGIGCVVPLHRRADRLPPVKAQVLAHPDLLAVPQRRGARQRELQGVGELDPAAVTAQHRRQPATNAAAVQPHFGAWREGAEDVTALFVGESAQVELVVVAEEADPLPAFGQPHCRGQSFDQRLRVAASQSQPDASG